MLAGSSPTAEDTDVADDQSLRAQLAALIDGAQRAQDTFAQFEVAAEARTQALRAKIEDLEAQNLTRAFRIRELEQENAELRESASHMPRPANANLALASDLARVTKERDDVQRQLGRARDMIKDLLSPKVNASAGPECTCGAAQDQQASASARARASTRRNHPQPIAPEDSDDESTVRPPRSGSSRSRAATPAAPAPGPPPKAVESDGNVTEAAPELGPSQESVSTASSATIASDAPSSASRVGKKKVTEEWYLEFTKPPAAVEALRGPISFEILAKQLELDRKTQCEITNLESMPGYDTRINAVSDAAFVFRPVILEGPGATYFIGWGTADNARAIEKWSKTIGDLHLFIWPAKQPSGWWYSGLHALSFVELQQVWPALPKPDKHRLLEELRDRNPGMNASQFRKNIREGKLVQICIELESKGRMESHDYMRETGLL
ncbi:hypothetical protein C8Q78DRAFT_61705 [Trametes maxima]|nr:hypothetical protein C8Q78DRAFT_61705 [Trametes maxima]